MATSSSVLLERPSGTPIEGRQVVFKSAHVKPVLVSGPHQFWEVHGEEGGMSLQLKASPSNVMKGAAAHLPVDIEEPPKEVEVEVAPRKHSPNIMKFKM